MLVGEGIIKSQKGKTQKSKLKNKAQKSKITIIGVGNLLMKDEGIGIHAVRVLQESNLPPAIRLIDGGTLPDLIAYARADDKIIIIDAAKAGGKAGTIYRFKPEDLASDEGTLTSAHDWGLVENLKLMVLTGNEPREVVIIGIEPKEIDWGTELSSELQKSLPSIVKVVMREINSE